MILEIQSIHWKVRHLLNSDLEDAKVCYLVQEVHLGHCHGGGDHFSVNTQFCKNCYFSSEIKYFSTKPLLSVVNTIGNKNIQKE